MIEHDPASAEFRRGVQESIGRQSVSPQNLGPRLASAQTGAAMGAMDDLGLWRDVFVQQKLPWGRFLQSAVIHTAAVGLIWVLSLPGFASRKF